MSLRPKPGYINELNRVIEAVVSRKLDAQRSPAKSLPAVPGVPISAQWPVLVQKRRSTP